MQYVHEWVDEFSKNGVTINGIHYFRNDFELLGRGLEKLAFRNKKTGECLLFPTGKAENGFHNAGSWQALIQSEKNSLDELNQLDLKTQRFQLVDAITSAGTVQVLSAPTFDQLCINESLLIHDRKNAPPRRIIGNQQNIAYFERLIEQLKNGDEHFNQQFFGALIDEYALTFTFQIPTRALDNPDDFEHLCLQFSENDAEPPALHYIFWDCSRDFSGIEMAVIPTLEDLKWDPMNPELYPLHNLAENITSFLLDITGNKENKQNLKDAVLDTLIKSNNLLEQAFEKAKPKAMSFITKQVQKIPANNREFFNVMMGAISTQDCLIIDKVLANYPSFTQVPKQALEHLVTFATKYKNQIVIDHLQNKMIAPKEEADKIASQKMQEELANQQRQKELANKTREQRELIAKLKREFVLEHGTQFHKDGKAFLGLASLFTKTNVNQNASLADMVKHAQGLSGKGNGERSHKVMSKLGWLNKNKEVSDELQKAIDAEASLSEENTSSIKPR